MTNKSTKPTHRLSRTPLYSVWTHMKSRCYSKNDGRFPRYGARGISVCDEWHDSNKFLSWALSNGYEQGLQIDRIDNNGNYEPSNCRFVTARNNARNRSTCKYLEYNGVTKSLVEWANEIGITAMGLGNRLSRYGMNVEAALTKPLNKHYNKRIGNNRNNKKND